MARHGDDVGETTATIISNDMTDRQRFWWRVVALLLLGLLLYLIWKIIEPLWQPVLWAVLLGALLVPLNERVVAKLGGRRAAGSTLTTILTVLLFVIPVSIMAAAVAVQATHLVQRIDALLPAAGGVASFDLTSLPVMKKPLEWLDQNAHVSLEQVHTWILSGSKKLLQKLATSGGTVVMGAVGTVVNFVLMVFVLFFVLRDGPGMSRRLMSVLPIDPERRDKAIRYLADVTRAVFLGIGVTALVQGALLGIAFWITGLPSPLVFGVLAALLALVPMVGTALIWIPAAIYLATLGEYWQAIFMAAWGAILVSSVDNFLRPLLISGRVAVPTLAVFLGVMGGLSAFGFIGLFLGPIVLGIVVALMRFEDDELSATAGPSGPVDDSGRSN